jgi:hypothetical protein
MVKLHYFKAGYKYSLIGYPYVQSSSQDREWAVHSRAATCLAVSDPASLTS